MKTPIYIVIEGGLVRRVENIPNGMQVQVIDKDIEGSDLGKVRISPIDGDACLIETFQGE
jgi:hypothetical protein